MKQKKQKSQGYKQSQEGKVSDLIKKLEGNLKLNEKIISMQQKIDKMKQQLTSNPSQASKLTETIAQYEVALNNYIEEMRVQNQTKEERLKILDKIRDIIDEIQPLPALNENEKKIHKDLKNLNRFEEHFLILRTKSQDDSFILQSSQIISQVIEKKNKIILMIDRTDDDQFAPKPQQQRIDSLDQFSETPTANPDENAGSSILGELSVKNLSSKSLQLQQQQNQKNIQELDQFETPTAGMDEQLEIKSEQQEQITQKTQEEIIEKKEIVQICLNEDKEEIICEQEKCQICFERKRRFVAIPCGHYIYCRICKELVEAKLKCLLCRQNVCKVFEVFS